MDFTLLLSSELALCEGEGMTSVGEHDPLQTTAPLTPTK